MKVNFIGIFINEKLKLAIPYAKDTTWIEHQFQISFNNKSDHSIDNNTFDLIEKEVENNNILSLNFYISFNLNYIIFKGYAHDLINFDFKNHKSSFKTKLITKEVYLNV